MGLTSQPARLRMCMGLLSHGHWIIQSDDFWIRPVDAITDGNLLGNCYTILDATKESDLPSGVNSNRLPAWLAPDVPTHFPPDFDPSKLRPDLLFIQNLSQQDYSRLRCPSRHADPATLARLMRTCVVHILELGYTSECSHDDCLTGKQEHNARRSPATQWIISLSNDLPSLAAL